MTTSKDFLHICELGLKGEKQKLLNAIQEIAIKESNSGRFSLYNALKNIVNKYSNDITSETIVTSSIKITSDKKDVIVEPNIWVSEKVNKHINSFMKYIKSSKLLNNNSLNRLLLYGPPGTGKTTLGIEIANQIGRPMKYVKISDIISPKLGETLKNIDSLFIGNENSIIFLDEFDAFAKDRKDSNDIGELKRTVNSFIQTLDLCPPNKIIIVSTNIINYVDSAILRRFKFKVFVDYLTYQEKIEFINFYIQHHKEIIFDLDGSDIDLIAHFKTIKSVDDIVTLFDKSYIDSYIVKGKEYVDIESIFEVLCDEGIAIKEEIKSIKKNHPILLNKLGKKLIGSNSQKYITEKIGLHRNSFKTYFNTSNVKKISSSKTSKGASVKR